MHQDIEDIMDYWFGHGSTTKQISERQKALWWSKQDRIDKEITDRFHGMTQQVATGNLKEWEHSPRGLLASILCVDQFPRNMFRNTPVAFAYDHIAIRLANRLLEMAWDQQLRIIERTFAYLPFEHSENMDDQNRSVTLYADLLQSVAGEEREVIQDSYQFALKHQEIIARFGRFPHRNRILGRRSSKSETQFLQQPGSSF